jgi:hypothetical protein
VLLRVGSALVGLSFGFLAFAPGASAATPTPSPTTKSAVAVADPSGRVLSRIQDRRITAPSSLAVSVKDPTLGYTMNDEGTGVLYTVQLSTGKVVGTTILYGVIAKKVVGMSISEGKLWIADVGDLKLNRFGGMLYSLDEPGKAGGQVTPDKYQVSYGGISKNMQAFFISPKTGERFLADRNATAAGTVWKLPRPLSAVGINRATQVAGSFPVDTTDAAFTPNGKRVIVLTDKDLHVFDPSDWSEKLVVLANEGTIDNGRGISANPDGKTFYVVNEALNGVIAQFPLTTAEGGLATDDQHILKPADPNIQVEVNPFLIILVVAGVGTLLWMVMQQNKKKPQIPRNMR